VVLATHADTALRLLAAPTPAQQSALGAVHYVATDAVLHDDPSLAVPGAPYTVRLDAVGETRTTWDMGLIQGAEGLFVTVGPPGFTQPGERFRAAYTHPALTPAALEALPALEALEGPLGFCGSYFGRTGAHEAAVASGQRAAARILGQGASGPGGPCP
jgi:predicted NAD/FAD-binding protein